MPEVARTATTALETALRVRMDAGGRAFVPYVTGGLPGVDGRILRDIEAAGADAVEIGVPFSDPVMDGGVIQEASRRALEAGFHPRDAFSLAADAGLSIPIVFMTYLNPLLAMGMQKFLGAAIKSGVGGVIVPDLPADEALGWIPICAKAGVAPVFLAAPGTSEERLSLVAKSSGGFIYCVSTYGVTGRRERLEGTLRQVVEAIRPRASLPLLAGVGISTPDQAAEACEFADGVVVGSALVERLLGGDRRGAVRAAEEFRRRIPL